MTAHPPID